jgi:hypothetical protein
MTTMTMTKTTTTAVVAAATTTVTTDPSTTARLPRRGAGLLLVSALLIGACSGDDESPSAASSTPVTTPTAVSTVELTLSPLATTPATAPAPPATVALPDGPTVLAQSLDALAPGYHFVQTVTVNGQVALSAEGDQIGVASRRRLTSQGVTVDQIILPEGTWTGTNGVWEELEDPVPAADPLAAFRTPTSLTVSGHSAELTTLVAAYPAAALGVPGDSINVTIELTGTTLRSFTYATPDGSQTSRTDIGPLTDTTPITSPATA